MSDPFKVVVAGPLGPFASDLHVFLTGLGYSPDSASQKLQLVAHLSRWMVERHLAVQGLSSGVVEEFFAVRRQEYRNFRTTRSLTPFLDFLERARIDRVADPPPVVSPLDELLGRFEEYLMRERGLRPTTIVNYLNQVRPFLGWRAGRSGPDWVFLSIAEVTDFLLWRRRTETVGSIRVAATALRAFLRWLFLASLIPQSLAEGLGLNISDINWSGDMLTVRGKRGNPRLVPIHPSTTAALSQYLKTSRDLSTCIDEDAFFLNMVRRRPHPTGLEQAFRFLRNDLGIAAHPGGKAPRLHDFRHAFATNALLEACRDGADVDARIAVLATYLGHVSPASPYWYLTAIPELLALASERVRTAQTTGALLL